MSAYYNEIDPYAAQWLRNLIAANLIAPGDVDERSIVDVRPDDLAGYTQCHFFAGIGGWSYAARLAGWPDDRELWTGSCPCQPFSLAGKRKGFDDDRHLWPVWREFIAERKPTVVFGEQVASATDWLGLVRSDLEAMGFAVGAIPVQAASAGADHLRDRFWFVADAPSIGRGEGRPEYAVWGGRNATTSNGGVGQADANHSRPQGRLSERDCSDQWAIGPDGVANAHQPRQGEGWEQRGWELSGSCGDQEPCAGHVSDAASEQARSSGQPRQHDGVEWTIGADGKARRVKSGIRLLAHGVPARVSKLRAFGNAIDPRPAAQVIGAYLDLRLAA